MEDTPPCQMENLGTGSFWHYHHWQGAYAGMQAEQGPRFSGKRGLFPERVSRAWETVEEGGRTNRNGPGETGGSFEFMHFVRKIYLFF